MGCGKTAWVCGRPCRLVPRVYCLDPKISSTSTHTHAVLSQISQRVAMEQSRARLLPGSQKFRRYLHPMGQACLRAYTSGGLLIALCLLSSKLSPTSRERERHVRTAARKRSIDSRTISAHAHYGWLGLYTSLARTCLSLSRDVGDSFEEKRHTAIRPPVVYALSLKHRKMQYTIQYIEANQINK